MDTLTIGNNFEPPVVNMDMAREIYEIVKSDEFVNDEFNALLAAVVTYMDTHGIEYPDKQLPWAETIKQV
jgi:hypothetical protein